MRNQPSTRTSAVSSGSPSYPSKSIGPRDPDPAVRRRSRPRRRRAAPRRTRSRPRSRSSRTSPPPARRPPRPARAGRGRSGRRRAGRVEARAAARRPASSSRWSWVGTSEVYSRVPAGGDHRECRSRRAEHRVVPGQQRPARPPAAPRRTTAAARAPTARAAEPVGRGGGRGQHRGRDSSTRLGAPVEPEVSISRRSGSSAASQSRTAATASGAWSPNRRKLTRRTLSPDA